jgi:hypothetical protein
MSVSSPQWQPVQGHLMTRWAKDVSPDNVLPEYPRPQMVRHLVARRLTAGDIQTSPNWLNLNGLWEYAVRPWETGVTDPEEPLCPPWLPDGHLLVPFPIESALSGVKRALQPDERLWYRRTFTLPDAWQDQRLLLHFGAVDWEARVWVNSQAVGSHRGGYDPFTFEITDHVQFDKENELVVAVWDPTDGHWQERGKQVLAPNTIWYTAVSGIWQTVWLEPVPQVFVSDLKLTPNVGAERLVLEVEVDGGQTGVEVKATAVDGDAVVATASGPAGESLTLSIPSPKLWHPDHPHLYGLKVQISQEGRILDRLDSYFAMRTFTLGQDEAGVVRLCLNGEPLFFYGPLDQGYWPDGLYTAPTDEALRYDLEICKRLGFNMMRKHIKVEPARWYYHCDRLGLVIWQDMVNGGKFVGQVPSFIALTVGLPRRDDRRYERHGREDPASRNNYLRELKAMIDALYNVPSIGMWIPFNEGWGQFDAAAIAAWVQAYDPTRPVDHASGWFDQGAGDVKSTHVYFKRLRMPRDGRVRAAVISEFGGYSLEVEGHAWRPGDQFGYKAFDSPEDLTNAYVELLEKQLRPLVARGLSGAVYTQLTDVEIEVNGYLTYDREVIKMDEERLQAVHRRLYETE